MVRYGRGDIMRSFWIYVICLPKTSPAGGKSQGCPGCSEPPSQWRHNGHNGVSNHQPHDRLLNRLFRLRSKKTSKLRVTSLCAGNSPVTVDFPTQRASNAENISIWWRHHVADYIWNRPVPQTATKKRQSANCMYISCHSDRQFQCIRGRGGISVKNTHSSDDVNFIRNKRNPKLHTNNL